MKAFTKLGKYKVFMKAFTKLGKYKVFMKALLLYIYYPRHIKRLHVLGKPFVWNLMKTM